MEGISHNTSLRLGILCAVVAAFLNSTIGIFSKILLQSYGEVDIVFAKCLVAFVLVSVWLLITRAWRQIICNRRLLGQAAICALFGISGMYVFETIAYQSVSAPVVVLCLMGTATLTTLLLGHYWLHEQLTILIGICLGFIMLGLWLMLPPHPQMKHFLGLLWGMLSGFCYGMFLLLAKRFQLPSNSFCIWLLVGFGALYLLPFTTNSRAILMDLGAFPYLIPLAIFPTVLGFFFTTKALSYTTASTVQFFELSEPVFSAVLAYLALGELMSSKAYWGAACIILALFLYQRLRQEMDN